MFGTALEFFSYILDFLFGYLNVVINNKSVFLLFILAGIANAAADSIQFKKKTFIFRNNDFIMGRGKFSAEKRGFWTKYPLSFIADGWHALETIEIFLYIFGGVLMCNVTQEYIVLFALSLYFLRGLFFELFYIWLFNSDTIKNNIVFYYKCIINRFRRKDA